MIRTSARALAIAASAVAIASGTAAVASASPPQSAPSSLKIDGMAQLGGMGVLHIVASGQRDAAGTTTGDYMASPVVVGMQTPIQVVGPVTCISVYGDTASLVYPISGVQPVGDFPGGLKDAAAIQVTVRKAGPGHPAEVGLSLPVATSSFNGCEPGPTPMTFVGSIDAS